MQIEAPPDTHCANDGLTVWPRTPCCMRATISAGDRAGLTLSINAATPEASGAEKLVPILLP